MARSRHRRAAVTAAVHFPSVSQPRVFNDAGEAYFPSNAESLPRVRSTLVHRSLDELVKRVRPFESGYGADEPHNAIRRRLGLPIVSASAAVRSPVRSVASLPKLARYWRAFNVLAVNKKVHFCVQRKQRREVLFARKIAGRSGLGLRGVVRRPESSWRCV